MNLDNILFMDEHLEKLEMKKYNFLYAMELERDYGLKDNNYVNKELANYIHQNYTSMDNVELKYVALKCLRENDLRYIVLNYELKHFRYVPQILTLDQFQECAMKIFHKYQHKAGGFLLEDIDWVVHKFNSTEYEVKWNERLFVNTMDKLDENDNETNEYLDLIIEMLQSMVSNIKIELREKSEKKDKISHILIWACENDNNNDIIGL